ncbi:MAG: DinB family protein [Anaerolineae bacterium]|nr:DinB family protein [Anaerolineae bacterium]
MTHPLVDQLRFTRSEWLRGLQDVGAEESLQRFEPMNCISWMVGHLARQEQNYWVKIAQGRVIVPEIEELPLVPPLAPMWEAWHAITQAADEYLDTLTPDMLLQHHTWEGQPLAESTGTRLYRNIYHYWYHLGESQAVRQMLGHRDLPQFVGKMTQATYR